MKKQMIAGAQLKKNQLVFEKDGKVYPVDDGAPLFSEVHPRPNFFMRFYWRYIRHWQQKYLCKNGWHKKPKYWRKYTSVTCLWCAHIVSTVCKDCYLAREKCECKK